VAQRTSDDNTITGDATSTGSLSPPVGGDLSDW